MKEKRRDFLKLIIGGVIGTTASYSLPRQAHAEMTPLEESAPQAKALKYVHDSEFEGKNCANCALVQGNGQEKWQQCAIFPQALVSSNGWCSAWVAKP